LASAQPGVHAIEFIPSGFVGGAFTGIVVDASDPAAPSPVGRLVVGEFAADVGTAAGLGLLVTYDRVSAVAVTEPPSPRIVDHVLADYGVEAVDGDLLHTATSTPSPVTPTTPTVTPTPTITPTPLVWGAVDLSLESLPSGCYGIRLTGTFSATSPIGTVGEMRTVFEEQGSCTWSRPEIGDADWEPFVNERTYVVDGGPHLFHSALAVEFRDDHENVSPVYCADIVGGCLGTPTPPPPQLTPTATAGEPPVGDRIFLPQVNG
jgi:hypothetical protein